MNVKLTTKEQEEKIKNATIELKKEANKIIAHEENTLRDISQPPTYFFFNFSFSNGCSALPLKISKEEKSVNTIEEPKSNKSLQLNNELENKIGHEGLNSTEEDENLKKEIKRKIKLKKSKRKDSNDEEEGADKENQAINLNIKPKKNKKKPEKLKKPILIEQTFDPEPEPENIKLDESSELIRIETKETTPILKRLRVRPNIKKHYC